MIRGKYNTSVKDPRTGHYRRVWEPCFILHVNYDPHNSPAEYAMIALDAEPGDKEGGMVIKRVSTHEIRLLRQRIAL